MGITRAGNAESIRLSYAFELEEMLPRSTKDELPRTLARVAENDDGEPYPTRRVVVAANKKSRNPYVEIEFEGIDFSNYNKNPIILFNHDVGSTFWGLSQA